MNILAISGSARRESTNTAFLKALSDLAPDGITLSVFADLHTLPVFSPDLEGGQTPSIVEAFMAQIAQADGLIICSPEYVRTLPGGLKNAIDWMVSRDEIIHKPIALAHGSHRGDDLLTALRMVLETVTERFTEEIFLRIPVMKQTPDEVAATLHQPDHARQVSAYLQDFIAWIESDELGIS